MPSSGSQPDPSTIAAASRVPRWLDRGAAWSWRLVVIAAATVAVAWLFIRLRVVMVPILIALMVSAVLSPLVGWLNRRGLPRLAATWLVLVGVVAVVGGVFAFVAWGLTSELTSDQQRWEQVADDVRHWLRTGPFDLSADSVDDLEQRVRDAIVGGAAGLGVSRVRVLIEVLTGIFLTAALTFFFIKDGPRMWAWVVDHVHPDRRGHLDEAGRASVRTLAAYLRAVGITGVVDGVAIGVGLWIIGVPLVIPLAIITFFGAFFPVVGATVSGAVAALVALVANGPGDALLVALLTLVIQQVEGDVVMPVVMGHQVPLHPAAVLASLAVGGALAGIVGAFVAVPVAAVSVTAAGVIRDRADDAASGGDPERPGASDPPG